MFLSWWSRLLKTTFQVKHAYLIWKIICIYIVSPLFTKKSKTNTPLESLVFCNDYALKLSYNGKVSVMLIRLCSICHNLRTELPKSTEYGQSCSIKTPIDSGPQQLKLFCIFSDFLFYDLYMIQYFFSVISIFAAFLVNTIFSWCNSFFSIFKFFNSVF